MVKEVNERLGKKEPYLILLALFIITVYLAPLFILQENAHIRVHDNLDSNIAWYKVLAKVVKCLDPFKLPFRKLLMDYQEMHLD